MEGVDSVSVSSQKPVLEAVTKEVVSPIISRNEPSSSRFKGPVFAYFTYTFSTSFLENKPEDSELQDTIEMDNRFFAPHRVATLFPRQRAYWEVEASLKRGAVANKIKQTIYDFTVAGGSSSFDEVLYGLYSRKVSLLTDDEACNIYCIKLDVASNVRIFAPEGDERKTPKLFDGWYTLRIAEGIDTTRDERDEKEYARYYLVGRANVTCYLLLKKASISHGNKFNPIVTVCLLVQSVFPQAEGRSKQLPTYNEAWRFEIESRAPSPSRPPDKPNAGSLKVLGRLILRRVFIQEFNRYQVSMHRKTVDLSKTNSDPVISHVLFVDSLVDYTFDPLRAYAAGSTCPADLFDLDMLLLRLLMDAYGGIDPGLLQNRDVFAGAISNILRPAGVDTTIYLAPYRSVSVTEGQTTDILTVLSQRPEDRDYTLGGPYIVASWNCLIDSFVTSQSLIFLNYSRAITPLRLASRRHYRTSAKVLKEMTEQALIDFEEYYDIDIVTSEGKTHFMRQYELSKRINNMEYYFTTLKDKILMYGQFQIADEQRNQNHWLIVLTVVVGLVPILIEVARKFGKF